MLVFDLLAGLVSLLLQGLTLLIPESWTRMRGSLRELTARYPGWRVHRAELLEEWTDTRELRDVVFVFGNKTGLSFRDGYGHQQLWFARAEIERLVLVSKPGDDGQWIRVVGVSAPALVEFWSPEDAGDVHARLTTALRT